MGNENNLFWEWAGKLMCCSGPSVPVVILLYEGLRRWRNNEEIIKKGEGWFCLSMGIMSMVVLGAIYWICTAESQKGPVPGGWGWNPGSITYSSNPDRPVGFNI